MTPEKIHELVRKYEPRVLRLVPDGCWTIPSLKLSGGGYLRLGRQNMKAHRAFYEFARGPILDGLTLDHLCRNRACINPDHLEAVTNKVNVLRGIGVTAQHASKTHCKNGHTFSGDNLFMYGTVRRCRACRRACDKRRRRRPMTSNQGPTPEAQEIAATVEEAPRDS